MRTEPLPVASKAGPDRIAHLLDQALRGLPRGRFGAPVQFTTKHGFIGVRAEGDLVPPLEGQHSYRRIHAVLINATTSSLVHVLYTARIPDSGAFNLMIDSLRREA